MTLTTRFKLKGSSADASYGGYGSNLEFQITKPYPYKVYWNSFSTSHDDVSHSGGSAVYLGFVPFDDLTKDDLSYSNIIAIAGGGGGYGEENFPYNVTDIDGKTELIPRIGIGRGGNAGISNEKTSQSNYGDDVTYEIYPGDSGNTDTTNNSYESIYYNTNLVPIRVSGGGAGGTFQEVSGHHITDAITSANNLESFYYGQGNDGQFLDGGKGKTYQPFEDSNDESFNYLYSKGGSGGSGLFGGGAGISVFKIQSGGGGGSSIINTTEVTNIIHSSYNLTNVTNVSIDENNAIYNTTSLSGEFEVKNDDMYSMSYERLQEFSTNSFELSSITFTPEGKTKLTEYRIHHVRDLGLVDDAQYNILYENDKLSYNSIGTYVVYGISGDKQITNRSTIKIIKGTQPDFNFVQTEYDFSAVSKTVKLSVTGGWSDRADVSFEIMTGQNGSSIVDSSFTYVDTGTYTIKATRTGDYNYHDISLSAVITINQSEQSPFFGDILIDSPVNERFNADNKNVELNTFLKKSTHNYEYTYLLNDSQQNAATVNKHNGLFTYKDVSDYDIIVTRTVNNFIDLSALFTVSIGKADQPPLMFKNTNFNYNRDTKSIQLRDYVIGGWSDEVDLSFIITKNGSEMVNKKDNFCYGDSSGVFSVTVTREGGQNYFDISISDTITISDFSVLSQHGISFSEENHTIDLSSELQLNIGDLTDYTKISFVVIKARHLHDKMKDISADTYSITDFSFSYKFAGTYDISTTELYDPTTNVQSLSTILTIARIPQDVTVTNQDISYNKTNRYDMEQLITIDESSDEPVKYTVADKDNEQESILQYNSVGKYNIQVSRKGNENYLDVSTEAILSITQAKLPIPVTFEIGGGTPDEIHSGKGAYLSFTIDVIEDVSFYWDISNGGNEGGSAIFVGYTYPNSDMSLSQILCIVGGGGKGSNNGFGGTAGYELLDISSTVDTSFAVYSGHPGTTSRGSIVANGGNMINHTFFTESYGLGGNGYRTGKTSSSSGGGGSTFVNLSKISSYNIGVNNRTTPFLNITVHDVADDNLQISNDDDDMSGIKEINWTPIRFNKNSYDYSYNDAIDLDTLIIKYTDYGLSTDISFLDTDIYNTELSLSGGNILLNTLGQNPEVEQYTVHATFIDPSGNYQNYSIDVSLDIHKARQPSMEFIGLADVSYDWLFKTISGTVSGGWSTIADVSYEISGNDFLKTKNIYSSNAFDLSYGNVGEYTITATKDGSRNYMDLSINKVINVNKNILIVNQDCSFTGITFDFNDSIYSSSFDLSQSQFYSKHEKITNDISYTVKTQPANIPTHAEIVNNTDFSYQYVGSYTITAGIFNDPNYHDVSTTFLIDISKAYQTRDFSFVFVDLDISTTYDPLQKLIDFTVSGGWSQTADISCEIHYTHRTITTISNDVVGITIIDPSYVEFDYTNAGVYDITVTRDGSWNYFDVSISQVFTVHRAVQELSFNDISFSYNESPYLLTFDLSENAIVMYEPNCSTDILYEITSQPLNIPTHAEIVENNDFSYQYVGSYTITAGIFNDPNYHDVSTTFLIDISKAYQTRDFSFVFVDLDISTTYDPLQKLIDFTVSGGWSQTADISCEIHYTHRTITTISNDVVGITIIDPSYVEFDYTNAGVYDITVTRDGSWNYFDVSISQEFTVHRAVQELSFNDISFAYKYDDTLSYDLSQLIDYEEIHCDGNIVYSVDVDSEQLVPTNAVIQDNTSIFDYSYVSTYNILAKKDGSTNYYDISDIFIVEILKANHFPYFVFTSFERDISYNPKDKDVSFTVSGGFFSGDISCQIKYYDNSGSSTSNVPESSILIKSLTDVSFTYNNTGIYGITVTRDGSWNYNDVSISMEVHIHKIYQKFFFDMKNRHYFFDENKEIKLGVSADLPTADISFVIQYYPINTSADFIIPSITDSSLNYGKYGNYSIVSTSKDLSDNYYESADSIILDIRRNAATTFEIPAHDMSFSYLHSFDLSSLINGVQSTGEIHYTVSSNEYVGDFSQTTDRYFHYDNIGTYRVTANISGDEEYFETSANRVLSISQSLQSDFHFDDIQFQYNKISQTFDLRNITVGGYANGIATYDISGVSQMSIDASYILQYNDLSYVDVSQCIINVQKSGINSSYYPDYTFQNYVDISDTATINISKIFQTFIMRNTTITTPVLLDFTNPLYLQDTCGNPIIKDSQILYIKYPNSGIDVSSFDFTKYLPIGTTIVRVEQPGDDIHITATSGYISFTVQEPQSFHGVQIQDFTRRIQAVQSRNDVYDVIFDAFSRTPFTLIRGLPKIPFFSQYNRTTTTIAEQSTIITRTQYESIYALIPNKDDFIYIPVSNNLNLIIKRMGKRPNDNSSYVMYLSDNSFLKLFKSGDTFVFSEYYFIFNNGVFFERLPVLSSCCPPVMPIVVSNISQKQEYAHYVRNTRYRKVFQGRARNVIVSDISNSSFTVHFETVGYPKEYIFIITDANRIQTKYTVNAEVHGTSYTFTNLNINESYLIDIKIQYITVKPYSLENAILVRTLPLITNVFFDNMLTYSFTVQIVANDYSKYLYEVECTVPNQEPLKSEATHLTVKSNTIVISGLTENTGYLVKINVYNLENVLQIHAGTQNKVVRTLSVLKTDINS